MAVETTTIDGQVMAVTGRTATAGRVTWELSEPGKVMDGSDSHRAMGEYGSVIGADGKLYFDDGETQLAVIPNDAITRDGEAVAGGTTYKVAFHVTKPKRYTVVGTCTVPTSPDPCDIGALTWNPSASATLLGYLFASSVTELEASYPAAAGYRHWFAFVREDGSDEDLTLQCLRNQSGTYEWVLFLAGGA